ncbi:hypothetical protein K402DRAFT_419454 [Aulographum hederae CBS 113979]|uniref:Uncharacterized protein n=1 Tax=Aulographum hederae CBS 113979 TaxID=1176131 RepID=A0A6G1H6P7_9PEZI|nr:hypothetical protein K402DRAFT_419454 [Aulographum hederae CBS 113979]
MRVIMASLVCALLAGLTLAAPAPVVSEAGQVIDISTGSELGHVCDDPMNSMCSYTLVPFTWSGQFCNGTNVTITANSLESIFQHGETIDPGFTAFNTEKPVPNENNVTASMADPPCWEFGEPYLDNRHEIPTRIKAASAMRIIQGFGYVGHLKGDAKLGAGTKGTCGRVSCSWNAGIYFCQDADHEQTLSWSSMADHAGFMRES